MKLYETPKQSKIKAETFNEANEKLGDFITFHHADGMYSYCTIDGVTENNVCHLPANQELKKEDDYYVLA